MVSLFGGFSGGFVVLVVFSSCFVGDLMGSKLLLLNLTEYKCGFEVFFSFDVFG